MEEKIENQEMDPVMADNSEEINALNSDILKWNAELYEANSECVTAALGFLCGKVSQEHIERLYGNRAELTLNIIEAREQIKRLEEE